MKKNHKLTEGYINSLTVYNTKLGREKTVPKLFMTHR